MNAQPHHAERELGWRQVLVGGGLIPFLGVGITARDAAAFLVGEAEIELGIGVSLVGGAAIPLHRRGVVSRDALAAGVEDAEEVLAARIALVGGGLAGGERGREVASVVGLHGVADAGGCRRGGDDEDEKC